MKNIINETSNRPLLLKIQKRIYSMVNKHFGGIFRDDAWQNVKSLRDAISNVEGVNDIEMWAGEYHNYLQTANTDKSPYRDYKTIVYTDFGNLSGYIRCCAAGTTEDPFSAYDIVISLYPEMNNESKRVNMKKTITESQLRNIIAEAVSSLIKKIREEYDPWMNGDASYIDGKYNINGEPVEINTRLSYVAIGDEYYFQGDEADEIIKTISKIWADDNVNQEEAIAKWMNLYL